MLIAMRDARSIVVAQLSFIGDMVFTTPLLVGLRELWPDASITVVGRPSALGVLDGTPSAGTSPLAVQTLDLRPVFRNSYCCQFL